MTNDKKRWVPVMFPAGPFPGSVNIAIKGENVVTSEVAKQLIDSVEGNLNGRNGHKDSNTGNASTEGTTQVPSDGSVHADVHASPDTESGKGN